MTERIHGGMAKLDRRLRGVEVRAKQPPIVIVRRTDAAVLVSGVSLTITWQVAPTDTHGMWSAGDPTAVVCVLPGRYDIIAQLQIESNATGSRRGLLSHYVAATGVTTSRASTRVRADPLGATSIPVVWSLELAVGDKLYLACMQNSGGNLNLEATDWAPRMIVKYWG